MSHSTQSNKIVAVIVLLVFALTFAVRAQVPSPDKQETVLSRSRDLLAVLYPEFSEKKLDLNLSISQPFDDPWRQIMKVNFQITRYGVPDGTHPYTDSNNRGYRVISPAQTNPVCSGSIVFNRHGWVHEIGIGDCSDAHSEQNESVRRLVEAHPEWSETDAARALKTAGARFGPGDKEEFIRSLRPATLQPFFGTLKILSVEFQQDWSEPHEGSSFPGFFWKVKAEAERPDGTKSPYSLYFEPFEGKLTIVFDGGLPLAPPID